MQLIHSRNPVGKAINDTRDGQDGMRERPRHPRRTAEDPQEAGSGEAPRPPSPRSQSSTVPASSGCGCIRKSTPTAGRASNSTTPAVPCRWRPCRSGRRTSRTSGSIVGTSITSSSPGAFDPEGTPEQSREWIKRNFSAQLDRFLTEYLWVNESDCLEDPLAARAVDPPPVAATGKGVSIPKEHIPVYYCLLAYFEMRAGHALRTGHIHQVLDQLGIPNTSRVKDRLIHLTLQLNELHDKVLDLSEYEHDPEAWDNAQYAFIERQARTTKALYDSFLEAVRKEGLDADAMHEIMVEDGRKSAGIAVYADDGEARYSPRKREILRLFEPDTTNPWLVGD